MPQQPETLADQTGTPKKKGYGAVVGIIVLMLAILAAFIFWPKRSAPQAPASTAPTPQDTKAAQVEDLNSLQADLDATNVDGLSDGL